MPQGGAEAPAQAGAHPGSLKVRLLLLQHSGLSSAQSAGKTIDDWLRDEEINILLVNY